MSEDQELRQNQRRQMTTGTRDLQRNFTIAAWMIRKHLDYLTSFSFQPKTGIEAVDQQLKEFMEWWELPGNFDAAGRHGRRRFLRLVEARRTLDGDCLINRLADGRLQGIEGDRIQTDGGVPFGELNIDPMKVVNGVYLNDNGRAISYMVFRRPYNAIGLLWDKVVPARFSDLVGYFDRFDQVRGISPLAPSINGLRDIYENFDYALAKAKISQLFAMAFYRESSEELGQIEPDPSDAPGTDTDDVPLSSLNCEPAPRYDINFGRGPMVLDLDPGDKAQILQDQTPSEQFQHFTQSMIMVALKALDLPYSFYDEAHTNWVGQRQANSQYMLASAVKQADLRDLLDRWTQWRFGLAVADGDIKLPKGTTARDLKWDWIATGIPPVDPVKEITADVAEINAGLSAPQIKCHERGVNFYDIIDMRAEAEAYAKGKGVILSTAGPQEWFDDPNNVRSKAENKNIIDGNKSADDAADNEPTNGKQKQK